MRVDTPGTILTIPGTAQVLDPVKAVTQWRRGQQLARAAAGAIARTRKHSLTVERADALIREAYAAAQVGHADLAAALVHERRTAGALMHALADVHDVADEPVELDDALAAHLAARLDTRRVLREVLIRDYGCDGCTAEPGEECFPNCLPSPRNASDEPTPGDFPATVFLVQPHDPPATGDRDVFAVEADAYAFVDAAGFPASVISERVVSHEAALSKLAATRSDPPQD